MISCITERHKIIRSIADTLGVDVTVPDDVVIGIVQAQRAWLQKMTWPICNG